MVELALQTQSDVNPTPVALDIVPVMVPALLRLDILDGYSFLAGNVTSRL